MHIKKFGNPMQALQAQNTNATGQEFYLRLKSFNNQQIT